ncbi:MAG: hypothetical protein FWD74_12405, partial [Actinomycetia bacterium]|nr:hypothetical protein [Actinomycetes bacterium]
MTQVRVIAVGVDEHPTDPAQNIDAQGSVAEVLRALPEMDELDAASGERRRLTHELMSDFAVWLPGRDGKSISAVMERIRESAGGPCLVYWVGHGEFPSFSYQAALADSCGPLNSLNALTEAMLTEAVGERALRWGGKKNPDDWLVLVLDTCASCAGAKRIYDAVTVGLGGEPRNTAIIGTSASTGTANLGEFPKLLRQELEKGFPAERQISVRELVHRLGDRLNDDDHTAREAGLLNHAHSFMTGDAMLPRPANPLAGLSATIDTHEEFRRLFGEILSQRSDAVRDHFFPKAQGAEIGEPAWHFTGREDARGELADWLSRRSSGMYI